METRFILQWLIFSEYALLQFKRTVYFTYNVHATGQRSCIMEHTAHCFFRRTSTEISSSLCTARVALVPAKSAEGSPLSALRSWTLSPTNNELCLADLHSCQPVQHTAQDVALLAPAMASPAYFRSAKSVCGLSAPQSAPYAPKDTRRLSPNACSFASVLR